MRTATRTGCVRYCTKCWKLWHQAPSTSSRTYAVYKVSPQHFQHHFQVFEPGTDDVFALIKCVDEPPDGIVVTELYAELEVALKQSDLYTFSGCEAITEITSQELDNLS
jgi:hypothetical protein